MSTFLTITVPGVPPSLNHSYKEVWRVSRTTGKRWQGKAKTQDAIYWQSLVEQVAHLSHPDPEVVKCRRLFIGLLFSCPAGRRPDLDNMEKLTIDAVAQGCGFNDKWLVQKASEIVESSPEETRIVVMEAFPEEEGWLIRTLKLSESQSGSVPSRTASSIPLTNSAPKSRPKSTG